MIDDEKWKDIYGYEKFYEVSNTGKVRSKERKTIRGTLGGIVLKGRALGKAGYLRVNLCKGTGNLQDAYIHRLVAAHFLLNPGFQWEVHHKDGNKQNNHIDNLEFIGVTKHKQLHGFK